MSGTVVLAARDAEAARLLPALEAAGFEVTRLEPGEADPGVLGAFSPRFLILETASSISPEALQPYWEGQEMDRHLPILLLEPPGPPAFRLDDLDEPVDRVATPADPREVIARIEGLMREYLVRIFRRHFHDLSQPLMIARAYSQRAVKAVPAGDALQPTLAELDRQVERMFRIAEGLQRRRIE